MKKILSNKNGFSLVELMVAVAVIGLLMAGIFGVLSTSILSFQNTADQGANVQLARGVLNAISNELRNATAVSMPAVPVSAAVTESTLNYVASDASNRQITMGTGVDANNVLIKNLDTGTSVSYGQGRVKAGSLQFTRSWDASWTTEERIANRRVFTVALVFKSSSNATETPISTVITTLNNL